MTLGCCGSCVAIGLGSLAATDAAAVGGVGVVDLATATAAAAAGVERRGGGGD